MSNKYISEMSEIEKIEQKKKNISKVVNRYMRMKRKSFFRKVFNLGFRNN
jgi:N-acetylneuraminic acid mutarotase